MPMETIAHGMLRTQTPVVFTMMMTLLLPHFAVDVEAPEVLQAQEIAKMTLL